MRIDFHMKGLELSPNLKTWLQKRLKKFERMDNTATAQVSLRKNQDKGPVEADILLRTQWGTVQSKNRAYDEKTALSRVLTKIEEQFRRYKEKSTVEKRRWMPNVIQEMGEEAIPREGEYRLRHRSPESFPLMTLEEAITQLRENGVQFFVFRDMDERGKITLVYPGSGNLVNVVHLPHSS